MRSAAQPLAEVCLPLTCMAAAGAAPHTAYPAAPGRLIVALRSVGAADFTARVVLPKPAEPPGSKLLMRASSATVD
jgi:tripartite-type tricarboxylate transporter receptor subunit TctC